MRFDTRNMTPQQIADAERQLNERMMGRSNQPFTGLPKSSMQPQVQQVQLPMGGFPGVGQQQMPPMQPMGSGPITNSGGYNPITKKFIPPSVVQRGPMQQPMGGFPGMGQQQMPPMQPQVQQTARQLSAARQYLNAMQQYRQGGRQGVRPTYAQFKQPQPGQQLNGMGQVVQPQNFGIAGGGTGMPPIGQPMPDPFRPQISGGPIGQPMPDPFKPQISGGPVGQPMAVASGVGNMPDPFKMLVQRGAPQPMSDPFKPQISGGPVGQPMDVASGVGNMPEWFKHFSGGPIGQPMPDPFKPQISGGPVGIAGGAGTTPTGGFGNVMDRFQQVQQIVGQPMSDPFKPQISGGPVGIAGGGTGMPPMPPMPTGIAGGVGTPPIGQPMGVAGGVGTPPQPNQPPMPMKKGGFAAKPVWDKERPEDLNKPKSLSVKKKKAAKARAKAAGRPYPNLVDNMAAARKKGK